MTMAEAGRLGGLVRSEAKRAAARARAAARQAQPAPTPPAPPTAVLIPQPKEGQ